MTLSAIGLMQMLWQKQSFHVGLAMQGMGKTVELLACIIAHPFPGPRVPRSLVRPPSQHLSSIRVCHTKSHSDS